MGLTQWGPQYHNTRRVEKLLQAFGGWEGEVVSEQALQTGVSP